MAWQVSLRCSIFQLAITLVMEDSEASLPKAPLVKLVRELLPGDVKVGSDTQDLIVKCSNEFVQLLATQANEVRVEVRLGSQGDSVLLRCKRGGPRS